MAEDQFIYLASNSPRRQELLTQLGVKFELIRLREGSNRQRDVDESTHPGESPVDYVKRLARGKASIAWQRLQLRKVPDNPVLAADTMVVLPDQMFGKPAGLEEAIYMLQTLSGRTHEVLTAVCLHTKAHVETVVSASKVVFRRLSDSEIAAYIATGEPMDKAGAYAIQGRAAVFIERIEGSYSGIMGLPLFETAQLLAKAGRRVL